jgi:hypothetical protein
VTRCHRDGLECALTADSTACHARHKLRCRWALPYVVGTMFIPLTSLHVIVQVQRDARLSDLGCS